MSDKTYDDIVLARYARRIQACADEEREIAEAYPGALGALHRMLDQVDHEIFDGIDHDNIRKRRMTMMEDCEFVMDGESLVAQIDTMHAFERYLWVPGSKSWIKVD